MIRGIRPTEVRPVLHSNTIELINPMKIFARIDNVNGIDNFMNWYRILALWFIFNEIFSGWFYTLENHVSGMLRTLRKASSRISLKVDYAMEEKLTKMRIFARVPKRTIPKVIKVYLYTSQWSIEFPFYIWSSRLTIFEKHTPIAGKWIPSKITTNIPTIKMNFLFIRYGYSWQIVDYYFSYDSDCFYNCD